MTAATKLVAVYGSLKKGQYNHAGLGADAEHLGDMTVRGVMYSNGSYPKLYKQDGVLGFPNEVTKDYPVEVYRIDEARYNGITRMEEGAGYDAQDIETPYGVATIYYMPHDNFSSRDHWVEAYPEPTRSPLANLD